MIARGFFAIGIWHPKTETNVGTLWRSAQLFGAAFVFTVGRRYRKQASDTMKSTLHVPLFHYETADDLHAHLPHGAPLVGVELCERARPLVSYGHPQQAVYLLGAEDHGLPADMLARCHSVIQIESVIPSSMNVAVAGSVLMWHRHTSGAHALRRVA